MTGRFLPLRRLRGDRRGGTLVEFALVAPAMLLTLLGLGDLLYAMFVQAALNGAMQRAGRDSTLQSGPARAKAIDARVLDQVNDVAPTVTIVFTRAAYRTFIDTRPEEFSDTDGDNRRDPGECYTDRNANKRYDTDTGRQNSGGGADDVVRYEAVATFPRIFPMAGLLGWSRTQQLKAATVLKNQPFALQDPADAPVEICSP